MNRYFLPVAFFTLVALAVFSICMAIAELASGQEVHHHPLMTEEVDQFYSRWRMPYLRNSDKQRVQSCCNFKDCHPAVIKREGGKLYGRTQYYEGWMYISESKIESNYADAEESPDGQNHMCHSPSGVVYCFTYGINT